MRQAKTTLVGSSLLTAFIVLVSALPSAAESFDVDPSHSSVGFGVRHMVVSTVRGAFTEFEGAAEVDLEDLTRSSVEVSIQAASVDTRQEDRDKHLRSEDFFDVENHPEITFVSTSIERDGDGLVAVGELTIRGTSRSVRMPVEIAGPVEDPWGNTRLGVSGRLTIDRTDYGLNYNRALEAGGLVVAKEVEIEIDVELVKRGS